MERIRQIIISGTPFNIRVHAGSSLSLIELDKDNIIKVRIKEIPENGKANKAVIALFSRTFKIPKSNIKIIKGEKSKNKTLEII